VSRILLAAFIGATMLRFTTPSRNADGTACTDLDSMLLFSTWQGRVKAHAQRDTAARDSFTASGQGGFYYVRAKDRAGNVSDPSNYVRADTTVTTDVPPEEPPPVVPIHSRCGGSP
jgi:hypothetical protein